MALCGRVRRSASVVGMKNVGCWLICSFFTRQTRGLEGGGKKQPSLFQCELKPFFIYFFKCFIQNSYHAAL